MTTDELKEAATKVIKNFASGYIVDSVCGGSTSIPADLVPSIVAVAEAYLALLPDIERMRRENDETPIDQAWLTSVGFVLQGFIEEPPSDTILADIAIDEQTGCYCFLRISLPILEAAFMQCQAGSGESTGTVLPKTKVKTRGDVRRLCSALGIPLTEPSPQQ